MSKIIGRPLYAPAPAGGGKPSAPKFTYDGDYVIRDDGVVELLTSGTLVFLNAAVIDRFMVGGGAGGSSTNRDNKMSNSAGGGGGGGYTRTDKKIRVVAGQSIGITIGEGGTYGTKANSYKGAPGGTTTWGDVIVNGGDAPASFPTGGNGGSGGGGGVVGSSSGGTGGSDGNNGEAGTSAGGTGQGYTTREFGEPNGKVYAGGGGGGRYISASSAVVSSGGDGGGGNGAWRGSYSSGNYQDAGAGGANTGGGGGGGAQAGSQSDRYPAKSTNGANGGSGIVCFREAQELPELAGTWVLNERLYAPESQVSYTGSYTLNGSANKTQMVVNSSYLIDYIGAQAYQDYNFSTNTWRTTNFDRTLIFPEGATATEEYKKWLASNATKQTA